MTTARTFRWAQRLVVACAAAACAAPVAAQTLVMAGSEIRFVSRQMGVPVEGRFTRFGAQLKLDLQQPQAGVVALDIDTRSIAFGAADTEAEAAKPAWFASAQHPQARFQSDTIRPLGGDRYEVTGRLTVKGQTRPVVVPVTLVRQAGGRGTASGRFTLKRSDFRLGEGEWADLSVVADEVQVRFRLELAGLGPG